MSEPKFLETPPLGFDITMELKWFEVDPEISTKPILCQKWQGAFRSVWVRVPCE